ncbi:serine/threonine-protein kinase CTR1-like isoform X2 [Tripterygium wilfordii]|uniref:serine/threonine-protein kinase CTR1-like isoform X2 n=1 Tax=Tripterygium wilfordii TaxID=458696 RepID=UPI0018F857D1|nr:serine/threonine-protein kinase CTR1-like isoform X2 [Tripterygium wilfordii]
MYSNTERARNSIFMASPYVRVARTTDSAALFKSSARQTEETYLLLQALALRLSLQAASADDPNFFVFDSKQNVSATDSAESMSHRFWVNLSLSYLDKIPDGFYLIQGMDPYAWTLSTNQLDIGHVPSFESLTAVDPFVDSSIRVVLIHKSRDPVLKELCDRVLAFSCGWTNTEDAVDKLANLVCDQMGGPASSEDERLDKQCEDSTRVLRNQRGSVVLPIGSLSVGLCVHRALLFKVLADLINLPCRISRGCKYCRRDIASSCIVQFGSDRERLVDLFHRPGTLSRPDSSLNSTSSILISSPLRRPRFKPVHFIDDFRKLATLYFSDSQSVNILFDDTSLGYSLYRDETLNSQLTKAHHVKKNIGLSSINARDVQMPKSYDISVGINNLMPAVAKPPGLPSPVLHRGTSHAHPFSAFSSSSYDTKHNLHLEANKLLKNKSCWDHIGEEHLISSWSELVIKEEIGSGSFGTVHRAHWHGLVAIMKHLQHPNIVHFMGACTQPPNLFIVTEYVSRGSLDDLLRMSNAELILDERCRLNMAYDVAKGMAYLHQLKPPIVHRDLKSSNLLVDSSYTIKVCDFGLSRSKAKTFLSTKKAAGTPAWLAPEVLRNEASNEKSDVYSFGVILWELMTLQRPWKNLSQFQVVAAVGFMGQKLEIPCNLNPQVAALIDVCMASEPSKRPSFPCIVESLQQLMNSMSQP